VNPGYSDLLPTAPYRFQAPLLLGLSFYHKPPYYWYLKLSKVTSWQFMLMVWTTTNSFHRHSPLFVHWIAKWTARTRMLTSEVRCPLLMLVVGTWNGCESFDISVARAWNYIEDRGCTRLLLDTYILKFMELLWRVLASLLTSAATSTSVLFWSQPIISWSLLRGLLIVQIIQNTKSYQIIW
jgi:hypothetical protein